jgi:hypothetical protein
VSLLACGVVGGDELDVAVHQRSDEGDAAAQAVELTQRRAMALLVSPLTASAMVASRSIISAAYQIFWRGPPDRRQYCPCLPPRPVRARGSGRRSSAACAGTMIAAAPARTAQAPSKII